MTVGPFSGVIVLSLGVLFHSGWIILALRTRVADRKKHIGRKSADAMG